MRIERIVGSVDVAAPRSRVWEALRDPELLARTLPGCRGLEVTGPDTYAGTVDADVASARGSYRGTVSVTDLEPPGAYRLTVEGAGTLGSVRASASVRLEEADDVTTVHYDGRAEVAGTIGGLGQGLLVGVAQRNVAAFFAAVERELSPVAASAEAPAMTSAQAPAMTPDTPDHLPLPAGVSDADRSTGRPRRSLGRALAGAGVAIVATGVAAAGVLLRRRLRR